MQWRAFNKYNGSTYMYKSPGHLNGVRVYNASSLYDNTQTANKGNTSRYMNLQQTLQIELKLFKYKYLQLSHALTIEDVG